MALSRERRSDLIILAADMLRRIPTDRLIREVGASAAGATFQTLSRDEIDYVEELLDNTIAYTERDSHTGNLGVGPRWSSGHGRLREGVEERVQLLPDSLKGRRHQMPVGVERGRDRSVPQENLDSFGGGFSSVVIGCRHRGNRVP